MTLPTIERLCDLLTYDSETGVLRWRLSRRGAARAGTEAGSIRNTAAPGRSPKLYRYVSVDDQRFKAHRIAFAIHHGRWPALYIDHVNGDGLDNRIANLREATRNENAQNQVRAQRHNKGGVLGVRMRSGRFTAQIWRNGKLKHLGSFNTPAEASAAYWAAREQK